MIIGISGFCGSDTLKHAQRLSFDYGAPIISLSSFGQNLDFFKTSNWDIIDFNRVIEEVIKPYKDGFKMLTYGVFSWEKSKIVNKTTVTFKDSIIIEGAGLFREELLKFLDQKIWIDNNIEDAMKLYEVTYKEKYGRVLEPEIADSVKRNDLEYFDLYKPLDIADEIIKN